MKIYLIRHGETTGDVEDRYGGSYDDHLTEKGQQQIKDMVYKVADKGIEKIFCSPLIRAKESAEIINSQLQCGIKIIDEMRERSYGILGGLTKTEAEEKYPEAAEAHKNPQNTDPEGESLYTFNTRVIGAFESITKQGYKTVAIMSHGGPIKVILKHLGKPIPITIDDGGVIEL